MYTFFHFLEKAEICIIWKLLTVLDENCSSTMFLCYLFQCKTAVDEYADILFELIANELVIYQSVLQKYWNIQKLRVLYETWTRLLLKRNCISNTYMLYLSCCSRHIMLPVFTCFVNQKYWILFLGSHYSVYNAWIL